MQMTTIGVDLAKTLFQIHGVDAAGHVVVRKALRRAQLLPFFKTLDPCLVGMEACSGAHHWSRELSALGHSVKLMPPSSVKPYVKRGKNDMADAEAICEAVTRPTMRFVPAKTIDQQAVLMLHRTRALLTRQRTMAVNALRGHLAEFGLVAAQGMKGLADLICQVLDAKPDTPSLPDLARAALTPLAALIGQLQAQIKAIDGELMAWHKANEASRRLETIPGIGFITATALAATVTDPSHFKTGRQFAAWLGLVPRQNSSGGSRRWAIGTFAPCSSSAPPPLSAMPEGKRPPTRRGSMHCWLGVQLVSSRWPSPTRRHGSPGQSWRAGRPIASRRQRKQLRPRSRRIRDTELAGAMMT